MGLTALGTRVLCYLSLLALRVCPRDKGPDGQEDIMFGDSDVGTAGRVPWG